MKLYWGPHTCAIGIHILLEEIGAPYETEEVDVAGGATQEAPFLAINPKGKVPTLVRDDGSVLTEFGAIATWLARAYPDKRLIPADPDQEARAAEVTAYVEGTIHGQGFARLFSTPGFEPQDLVHQVTGAGSGAIKAQGREIAAKGFAILEPQLGRHAYAAGDAFSVADAALFYAARWAPQFDIALPPNVAAHLQRMKTRPAVLRVMELWGEE